MAASVFEMLPTLIHPELRQLSGESILSASQFNRRQQELLVQLANEAGQAPDNIPLFPGVNAAIISEQPSTRTIHTTNRAAQSLGFRTTVMHDATTMSSASKGESYNNTGWLYGMTEDFVAFRSQRMGGVAELAIGLNQASMNMRDGRKIPVINCGDGTGEHPTQSLLDMATIYEALGHAPDGLEIAAVGDLKRARTVNSLLRLLGCYEGVKVHLISHPLIKSEPENVAQARNAGIEVIEYTDPLKDVLADIRPDIVYMLRTQSEHDKRKEGEDDEAYALRVAIAERVKSEAYKYILTQEMIERMRPNQGVMHPLPKNEEIQASDAFLSSDPRVKL